MPIHNRARRKKTTLVRLHNAHSTSLHFSLEPWGLESDIAPDKGYLIAALDPEGGSLEITVAEENIIVWASGGTKVLVFEDGELLMDGRVPLPPTPVDVDYTRFVEELWGSEC